MKIFRFSIQKRLLVGQIEEFIEWKSQYTLHARQNYYDILKSFSIFTKAYDIDEVTIEDIKSYQEKMFMESTPYAMSRIFVTLRGFFSYFKARHYKCISPLFIDQTKPLDDLKKEIENARLNGTMIRGKVGKPPMIEKIKQVKSLRDEKGMTFRAIGLKMGIDVSQIFKWYHYPLGNYVRRENILKKLSTESENGALA